MKLSKCAATNSSLRHLHLPCSQPPSSRWRRNLRGLIAIDSTSLGRGLRRGFCGRVVAGAVGDDRREAPFVQEDRATRSSPRPTIGEDPDTGADLEFASCRLQPALVASSIGAHRSWTPSCIHAAAPSPSSPARQRGAQCAKARHRSAVVPAGRGFRAQRPYRRPAHLRVMPTPRRARCPQPVEDLPPMPKPHPTHPSRIRRATSQARARASSCSRGRTISMASTPHGGS